MRQSHDCPAGTRLSTPSPLADVRRPPARAAAGTQPCGDVLYGERVFSRPTPLTNSAEVSRDLRRRTAADRTPGRPSRPGAPHLVVEQADRWQVLTWLAAGGLVAAAAMAAVGLPAANLHSPLHALGIMDPLCGGTRSVRLAVMGQWSDSLRYNPIGVPLVVGAAAVLLRAVAGRLTGRWIAFTVAATARSRRIAWGILVVALIALEVNQQAHAALLVQPN